MNDLRLDSHKLMFHPQRVTDFLAGKPSGPLYLEVGLSNRCNHQCAFCGLDYRRAIPTALPYRRVRQLLSEFKAMGGCSVCFAGEGEPLLYPDLPRVLDHCRNEGLDAAIATNGSFLTPELEESCCRNLTWIKFSLNAVRPKTYARLHGVDGQCVWTVFRNLERLAEHKRRRQSRMTIGVQALLLPGNAGEMIALARAVRDAGADYFIVKPYNRNRHSLHRGYGTPAYRRCQSLAKSLAALSTASFTVQYRVRAFAKLHERQRPYSACEGIHFLAFVSADGGVPTCPPQSGDRNHEYGNIMRHSLREIWNSARRRRIVRRRQRDLSGCMPGCRLDEINRYLWELRHPGPHVNFI